MKLFQNRPSIKEAAVEMFYHQKHELEYNFDQQLLHKYLWPLAQNDSVQFYYAFNIYTSVLKDKNFIFNLVEP